jgi:hypothetical protein
MPKAKMTPEAYREHARTHDKQNSWWMNDARGIPCTRVCDTPGCRETAESKYKPEVLGKGGRYEDAVEEPIEPDE